MTIWELLPQPLIIFQLCVLEIRNCFSGYCESYLLMIAISNVYGKAVFLPRHFFKACVIKLWHKSKNFEALFSFVVTMWVTWSM